MNRLLAALAALLVLPSCYVGRFNENEPLRIRDLAELQPHVTTAREVVERLGAPADVVQLGKRSAYLYLHRVEKNAGLWLLLVGLYGEDVRSDRVWLFFDESNVLSHVGVTLASHRARYTLPWLDVHDDPEIDLERDQERFRIEAEYERRKAERMAEQAAEREREAAAAAEESAEQEDRPRR
jgi:hypothetical protein